jgi:hypothetical protein
MSGTRRRVTLEERRARLARRHHLAPGTGADGPLEVARDLVALHATDPSTVYLATTARMRAPEIGAVERALYDDRVLVRLLGMRRTMFVVPVDLVPVVQASSTRAVAAQQRRLLVQHLEGAAVAADAGAWLRDVEASTVQALRSRGEATAEELTRDEPRLRQQLLYAEGKPYESRQNITTRVLTLLSAEGRIVRGRPRGTWTSSQYRWSPAESWLPEGLAEWSTEAAQVELVRRWLAAFGPAPAADLRWWTGWTAGHVTRALKAIVPVEVDLDGATGLLLPGDEAPAPRPEPWVALLPALDPTVMGWAERGWYLGGHGPALFDRSGNAGPTVWWDGHVVGGWAHRKDGRIELRLLEDVGREGREAVEAAAQRLGAWLGPVRITPRFRTPLERELSA